MRDNRRMNRLAWLMLLASNVGLAQVEYHGTVGQTTADVKSYAVQEPDIPGFGKTLYRIAVSFQSDDDQATVFDVALLIKLSDGSGLVIEKVIQRERAGIQPARPGRIKFTADLGDKAPVEIQSFTVLPLAPKYPDVMVGGR